MKKIKSWLFPQKGKEKPAVRFYIVITYTALVLGIIFSFAQTFIDTARQNNLYANTVQEQLGWALLDSSITSDTVRAFQDSKISGSERDLSKFSDGYDYKYHLLFTDIPNLASQAENQTQANNIKKVGDILEQNIENYRSARLEIFSPSSAIVDGLLYILVLIIPLFIFFRAVVYRIVLYVVFGKTKS
jgi:uncharacterized membrane protein (DUF106 family)